MLLLLLAMLLLALLFLWLVVVLKFLVLSVVVVVIVVVSCRVLREGETGCMFVTSQKPKLLLSFVFLSPFYRHGYSNNVAAAFEKYFMISLFNQC